MARSTAILLMALCLALFALSSASALDVKRALRRNIPESHYFTPETVERTGEEARPLVPSLLQLGEKTFIQVRTRALSNDDDDSSNPIYLLPVDPNYAPSGPQGFFPSNMFGPMQPANNPSVSPPPPTAPQGPDLQGTVPANGPPSSAGAAPAGPPGAPGAPPGAPPGPSFRSMWNY